jgi:hypothetical protein
MIGQAKIILSRYTGRPDTVVATLLRVDSIDTIRRWRRGLISVEEAKYIVNTQRPTIRPLYCTRAG